MAHERFSFIAHDVGVEASFPLGRDIIGWRQLKTTGMTPRGNAIVKQFAQANNEFLAGGDQAMANKNTENDSKMKKEAEEKTCTE